MAAAKISLTTQVKGTLPVANGGTGATTFTDAGVLIGNSTGAIQVTTAGTAGQVLTSNGAGVDPTFQTPGGVSTSQLQQIFTAGESLTAGNAVAIINTENIINSTRNDGQQFLGATGTFQKCAQSFSITYTSVISSITTMLNKVNSPTDNAIIRIETDSSGSPSGTLVDANATFTIAGASVSTTFTEYTINSAGSFTLTAGTTYWAVFTRSGARDVTNVFQVGAVNTNVYAGGQLKQDDSGTWGAVTGTAVDINKLSFGFSPMAVKTNVSDVDRKKFAGFVDANASAGASVTVNFDGVDNNQSGLTPLTTYVLTGSSGGITAGTYPYSTQIVVGKAISATEIMIQQPTVNLNGNIWTFMETITFTASSSIQTTADFANASTAKQYMILVDIKTDASSNYVEFRLNGNSTANTYITGYVSYNGNFAATLNSRTAHTMLISSATNTRCSGQILIAAQEGASNTVSVVQTLAQNNVSSWCGGIGYAGIGATDNYVKNMSFLSDANFTGTFSIYQR